MERRNAFYAFYEDCTKSAGWNGQYPCTFVEDAKSMKKDLVKLIKKSSVDILYLGLGASALCFVTWNFAVNLIGLFLSEYKPERNRTENGFTK